MSAAPARPADVATALEGSGCCLVDVRTPVEFGSVHVEGATNVPLDQLASRLDEVVAHAGGRRVVLVCRSGQRAQKALEILERRTDLRPEVLEGGVEAWERAGLPVVRGAEVMSLERQVRIAAGSLVLVGVALGFLVHPGFFGLSGFVGAGLVFAGVTDTCGMGMLLARMPWNKRAPACPTLAKAHPAHPAHPGHSDRTAAR